MKSIYVNGESFNNDDIEGWGSLGDVTAWFYVCYQFIFFFFLNYISYMSTSPSSHHDHFINNIYFFPCCILGIVLSVSHLYLQILLQVRLPWSELELQIWDFKQNFARNCCLLFFSFFSLSCSLFLSLSCFSNLTLFPPANYQLILVNYLLIVFLAMART